MSELVNNPDVWKNLASHIIVHSICEYATMVELGMAEGGVASENMRIPNNIPSRNVLGGITNVGEAHECIDFLFKPSQAGESVWDYVGVNHSAMTTLLKCPFRLSKLKRSGINAKLMSRKKRRPRL